MKRWSLILALNISALADLVSIDWPDGGMTSSARVAVSLLIFMASIISLVLLTANRDGQPPA